MTGCDRLFYEPGVRSTNVRWSIDLTSGLGASSQDIDALSARWSNCVVAIARERDRRQFALLFDYFAPRLKGYFGRVGVSADLAEDLAQETLLTVWRKAAYFDPSQASASTWIFTIARNLRVDMRRRSRDPHAMIMAQSDQPSEPSPDAQLLVAERETKVRAALQDLPQSEIAEVLGIPLGTVKSRVRLALGKLRLLVEELQ